MAKALLLKKNNYEKCNFCHSAADDEIALGEKFRFKDLILHYYCVLLSHQTLQQGADDEGLRGFLYDDIKQELKRVSKMKCVYCSEPGPAIQCHKCKIKFHLPCGLRKNSMSQFKEDFRSYCITHRPRQTIPSTILEEAKKADITCSICLEEVSVVDSFKSLWAPCCQKNWYHRDCIQQLALSQALLFKCAFCANTVKFKSWMVRYGIFVPERDAAWELEPGAYEALHQRHSTCDVEECLCPYGRSADRAGSRWEVVICNTCGSQGTHVRCSNLKFCGMDWKCSVCSICQGPVDEDSIPLKRLRSSDIQRAGEKKFRYNSDGASTSHASPKSLASTSDSDDAEVNARKTESPFIEVNVTSMDEEKKNESFNWLCVRKKEPESNSSTDVEVVELYDELPRPEAVKTPEKPVDVPTPEKAIAETKLPADEDEKQFLLFNKSLYEIESVGEDGRLVLKKKNAHVVEPEMFTMTNSQLSPTKSINPVEPLQMPLDCLSSKIETSHCSNLKETNQVRSHVLLDNTKQEEPRRVPDSVSQVDKNQEISSVNVPTSSHPSVPMRSVVDQHRTSQNTTSQNIQVIDIIDVEDDEPLIMKQTKTSTKKKKKKKKKSKNDDVCIIEESTPGKLLKSLLTRKEVIEID